MPKAQTGQRKYRPRKRDRDIVLQLAEKGLPQELICTMVENPDTGKPISKPTLYKHFPKELALGRVQAGEEVSDMIFTSARAGSVTSQIWLSKIFLKWKETTVVETHAIDPVEAKRGLLEKFGVSAPPDIIEAEYEEDEPD